MLSLILDTCTVRGLIAFVKNGSLVHTNSLLLGSHQSNLLVPKLKESFQAICKEPHELDWIAVSVGPGSYTGIRAGVMVAKSLSYSFGIPLIGMCSLEGWIPEKEGRFAAVLDAKMDGCYVLKGERTQKGIITYTSSPEVLRIERMREALDGVERVVSPEAVTLQEKLAIYGLEVEWREGADPLHLAARALEKFQKGEYRTNGSVEFLYLKHKDSM